MKNTNLIMGAGFLAAVGYLIYTARKANAAALQPAPAPYQPSEPTPTAPQAAPPVAPVTDLGDVEDWIPAPGTPQAPVAIPTTRKGDPTILFAQKELNVEGYVGSNGKKLDEDGIMGPNTKFALGAYQSDNGLYVTDQLDDPTLNALRTNPQSGYTVIGPPPPPT